MRFVRLTDEHLIKPFNCGDEQKDLDLADFLVNNARLYAKERMGVTYLIEDDNETVCYCTVLNDKISMSVDEKHIWNRINRKINNGKRRKSYPAIKIGCLATNIHYTKMGFATKLVDFVRQYLLSDRQFSGCRFMTIDAYNDKNVLQFYENYGFRFFSEKDLTANTRSMYFDICG